MSCCSSCAKGGPCGPDHRVGAGGGSYYTLANGGGQQLGYGGPQRGGYGYHSPRNSMPGRNGSATLGNPIPASELCAFLPDTYAGNVARRSCTLALQGMDLAEVCAAPPQVIIDVFSAFNLDLAGACEALIRRQIPQQDQAPPDALPDSYEDFEARRFAGQAGRAEPAPAAAEQALSDLDVIALVNSVMNTPGPIWAAVFSPSNVGGQRLTVETLTGPVDLWIFGYGVSVEEAAQRLSALPLAGARPTYALVGLYPAAIGVMGFILDLSRLDGTRIDLLDPNGPLIGLGTGDYIDAAGEGWSDLREDALEEEPPPPPANGQPPPPMPDDQGGGILPLIAAAGLASLVL